MGWKSLPADKKKTYEERASKAKAEYVAYIAKVKGTEAFQAYIDKKAVARKKKLKRAVRSAMHKVPKDAKLKKPLSGYVLWFKGARSTIKGKNIAEVSKKAGEMWKGLFADKAQEAKKTYDAYVATSKGAAALKAYKDAISKARAPLTKNSDAAKAKKAAAKVKAKAKREKAKARAAAAKAKVIVMKAATADKKKAKVAAKAK